MENEEQNLGNQPTGGALSIYGQADAAMDDFPVLKAFQQYIDAEQSKSRKRMILLCMFFGALMTILVAVFVFMLAQASRDKQHVNDQLIEFLMKERERAALAPQQQPVVQQPASNPSQDAALKAVTETLVNLQKQMAEQQEAAREAAESAPTKAELERERKAAAEAEKLRRAQEQLAAEKRRLADEKERLHQQEVERQRRRLYPEYYQKQEGRQEAPSRVEEPLTPSPKPAPKRQLSDADIDDILREVDALKREDEKKAAAKAKAKEKSDKEAKKKEAKKKKAEKDAKEDKPIEYFSETEYALPLKVNGEDAGFSIPLD